MTQSETDRVLAKLASMPLEAPSAAFSARLRATAHARLVPRKLHPAWSVAVGASVVAYLSWALLYTSQLY